MQERSTSASWGRFTHAFGVRGTPVVLPVIYVADELQVVRNARIARDAGADGAFLISVDGRVRARELAGLAANCHRALGGFWIGVNCLELSAREAFETVPYASGIWSDDAGIDPASHAQHAARATLRARYAAKSRALYFGSVAFKTHAPLPDALAARVAQRAVPYVDVVTTSGPQTGVPPRVDRVAFIRRAITGAPLAIASGVTPANVRLFAPHVDAVLVATGVSRSEGEFDPALVSALVRAASDSPA